MKLWKFLCSLTATAVVAAMAMTSQAAVQNTKHNMNKVYGASTIQDNQVCLPCHAPHNQPDPTQSELWNHVMPADGYTLYGAIGTYVETNSGLVVGLDETSKKCLSCHDGTVAVDSYGGYNFATGDFSATTGSHSLSGTAWAVGGGTQDLSHDHPVGVTYPGLADDGVTWDSTQRSYKAPSTWTRTTYSGVDASNATVTLNYTDGTKNISVAGGGFELSSTGTHHNVVGCGSCHSPHSDTYNFLVISNYNSQMCLTCHNR